MICTHSQCHGERQPHFRRAHRMSVSTDVRLVDDEAAINGESPQWDDARRRLWWVDMRRPALHVYEPASGHTELWDMPAWIGCSAILRDGRLALALRTGLPPSIRKTARSRPA